MASGSSLTSRIFVFAAAVAVILVTTPALTRRAAAAPDNTLGMALLSARVTSGGILEIGSGATGASQPFGTGTYQVDFDRDVSGCVYGVTLFDLAGETLAQPRSGVATAVYVSTKSHDGSASDRAFYLLVFCHR